MPKRACLLRGPKCSNNGIAVPGTSRCPAHSKGWTKSPEMQARSGHYNTRSWRERSKKQLVEFPDCAKCGARASVADHIDNIGAGGDWFGPLQSLCKPCHAKKTASEGGKAAKAKRETR
jgi:hypothetical protein